MLERSARLCALLLAASLLAGLPVSAQEDDDSSSIGRTWEIYLKSGQRIAFEGQTNWAGSAKGPSQLLADYQAFVTGGSVPAISQYSFPTQANSGAPVATILIDLREVIAIVQKF